MTLTAEQRTQLLEAAKPLIKWLSENCHPHCTAHVDQISVQLKEDVARCVADEFLEF